MGPLYIKRRKSMGLPGVISPLEVEFIALTTLVITGSRVHLVRVDQFFLGLVDASHRKRM